MHDGRRASVLSPRRVQDFDGFQSPEARTCWAFQCEILGEFLVGDMRISFERLYRHLKFVRIAFGCRGWWHMYRLFVYIIFCILPDGHNLPCDWSICFICLYLLRYRRRRWLSARSIGDG